MSHHVGFGTTISPFCYIESNVVIGEHCTIGVGTVIGTDPQHAIKQPPFGGVVIGNHVRIREHCTIHAALEPGDVTTIGDRCYLMAGTHVGHDCCIEDDVILASPKLAGHTHVMCNANVGLGAVTHQYTVIGTGAMVGCGAVVVKDIPPYMKVAGNPVQDLGENHYLASKVTAEFIEAETARFHALRVLVGKRGTRCL